VLYRHLPFNKQWEGCIQLHCVSFSLVVIVGKCAVLSLCWFEPSIIFFMFGIHEKLIFMVFILQILLSWFDGGKHLQMI